MLFDDVVKNMQSLAIMNTINEKFSYSSYSTDFLPNNNCVEMFNNDESAHACGYNYNNACVQNSNYFSQGSPSWGYNHQTQYNDCTSTNSICNGNSNFTKILGVENIQEPTLAAGSSNKQQNQLWSQITGGHVPHNEHYVMQDSSHGFHDDEEGDMSAHKKYANRFSEY